ncbi:thioredoxin family protein [Paraburkholderia sp. CNPSo 3272]|uniref:thioredoxin family protein n=1 Tax=unclassified Paraburkholderia TaxID=2615204 RepID=UPI0020B70F51|nr:thioredoxin family protein [Paraburkholderia sp. CNPSo 3272]MCP3722394.1 thioredoxin family protein [Paraburkholderia sp. CNPSo 3272]
MISRLKIAAVAIGLAATAGLAAYASGEAPSGGSAALQTGAQAPDFTGINNWLNSPPLDLKQLHGKVVLVDFWTFDCINCAHTIPHIKELDARYRDKGLVVVGVHTPEYSFERDTGNLQKAIKQYGITYPVAQDNGYATWNAYGNQYWPAVYLIDQNGKLVYTHFGEGDYAQTEQKVRDLLGIQGKQG